MESSATLPAVDTATSPTTEEQTANRIKRNHLQRAQFFRLGVWLQENAKGLKESKTSYEAIAQSATAALGFAVTVANAANAIEDLGIDIPRPNSTAVDADRVAELESKIRTVSEGFSALSSIVADLKAEVAKLTEKVRVLSIVGPTEHGAG